MGELVRAASCARVVVTHRFLFVLRYRDDTRVIHGTDSESINNMIRVASKHEAIDRYMEKVHSNSNSRNGSPRVSPTHVDIRDRRMSSPAAMTVSPKSEASSDTLIHDAATEQSYSHEAAREQSYSNYTDDGSDEYGEDGADREGALSF